MKPSELCIDFENIINSITLLKMQLSTLQQNVKTIEKNVNKELKRSNKPVIIKTKNVKGVSIHSLSLFLLTNVLWFMHGYFISDYSLIVGSTIGMIISILSLLLHVKYSK